MAPSEIFYKTHKVSQKDFLGKLREAKNEKKVKKLIKALYDDESISGRRGLMSLKDSTALVKRKVADKNRARKFAERVTGNEEGMSFQQLR